MNTDPQDPLYGEIRKGVDIPVDAKPFSWTDITEEEALILMATPKSERMTLLRKMRPSMSHNQRKQTLKRRGMRDKR